MPRDKPRAEQERDAGLVHEPGDHDERPRTPAADSEDRARRARSGLDDRSSDLTQPAR